MSAGTGGRVIRLLTPLAAGVIGGILAGVGLGALYGATYLVVAAVVTILGPAGGVIALGGSLLGAGLGWNRLRRQVVANRALAITIGAMAGAILAAQLGLLLAHAIPPLAVEASNRLTWKDHLLVVFPGLLFGGVSGAVSGFLVGTATGIIDTALAYGFWMVERRLVAYRRMILAINSLLILALITRQHLPNGGPWNATRLGIFVVLGVLPAAIALIYNYWMVHHLTTCLGRIDGGSATAQPLADRSAAIAASLADGEQRFQAAH